MAKEHKQKKINWKNVAAYLKAGCSGREIAAMIGVHENTLYMRCKEEQNMDFVAFKQEKQAEGDAHIKRAQYEEAVIERDRRMLIWLGKQRLGQREKFESTNKNLNADLTSEKEFVLEDLDPKEREILFKIYGIEDEFNGDHNKPTE